MYNIMLYDVCMLITADDFLFVHVFLGRTVESYQRYISRK